MGEDDGEDVGSIVVMGVGVMDGVRVGMPPALLMAELFHCVSLADQAQP